MAMSEAKKRKVRLAAVFGAMTGIVLAVVLYFVVNSSLAYFALIPIAAAMGAGQAYMAPDSE